MASKRQPVFRSLGGFDRSRRSHVSRSGMYDLLNLRPERGRLVQTELIGSFVDELGFEIPIVTGIPDWSDWTGFSDPDFGAAQALDMDLWTDFDDPNLGEQQALEMSSWSSFIAPTFGDEQALNMASWSDGGL